MPVCVSVGLSDDPDTAQAFAAAADAAAAGLDGACDLSVLFAGAEHLGETDKILEVVHSSLSPAALIGCGANGVIGAGREIEEGAGAVVWALSAPEASVETMALTSGPIDDGIALNGLPEELGETMIVLIDPTSFSPDALLAYLNEARPAMPVLGGLASAATQGSACLFLDEEVIGEGAVACSLSDVEILPCVSQGATPVGPEMTVTAAEGNVVSELASKPALERIREVIGDLDHHEQALAAEGLLLGVVIDENQPEYERGDFLVRPVIGIDPEQGAVAVASRMRIGQTVRIHVRDAYSASEDLRESLGTRAIALGDAGAAGALLFSCNGRGSNMFDQPSHDANVVADVLGAPAGGFFAAGEIGPVGGRNFMHGFTATMA
ncbi:MAG TPA: FIST N-terminal domain-containing protein, partial [Solirubrobacterales bacterium]|nr:FIST N-terminal domain-containing protein [Solirubrobacterales bacterium]